MLIAARITYSPQMLKEVTSLQNSSAIIFGAFQSRSGKPKQLPLAEAQLQRCSHLRSVSMYSWGLKPLPEIWTGPGHAHPCYSNCVAPFFLLFVSFFFFLRKQEPQKLDPVIFLWLQRRRHRCTLRGSHCVWASSFRTQVFWIVCGSKSMSLWNSECPGAYRSVCRNLFWMECKGSVFIAPVF